MDPNRLGLSPYFWIHFKMFIQDVLNVEFIQDYSYYVFQNTHPIRFVQLTGMITGKDESSKFVQYYCILFFNQV